MNCKDATRLMSEANERDLLGSERLGLKWHLLLCRGCRNFERHMDFIGEACRRYGKDGGGDGADGRGVKAVSDS